MRRLRAGPRRDAARRGRRRLQVAAFASTAAGNVACTRGMPIGSSYEESLQLLAQTQAAQDCELSFDGVYDVRRHVERASAGRVLTGSALVEIASTLQTAMRLKDTLQGEPLPRPHPQCGAWPCCRHSTARRSTSAALAPHARTHARTCARHTRWSAYVICTTSPSGASANPATRSTSLAASPRM